MPRFSAGRVHLAGRTLTNDPIRLSISLAGIAFAVGLTLLLRGIMDGTIAKSTTYIDHAGADLFVARTGVTNMVLATSALPESAETAIEGIDGVAESAGVLRYPVIVMAGDTGGRPAAAIGFAPGRLGGPWSLAQGREIAGPDEAVVDANLADDLGVGLGETISIAERSFTVVGLSSDTAAIAGKLVFVDRGALQQVTGALQTVNFVLVRLDPGVDAVAAAATVEATVPGLNALTRGELSRNDRDMLSRLFIAPINVMSTAGFFVGLAIVGLTVYATTAERLRDFGVLKAIGASDFYLIRTVAIQATLLGIGGYTIGYAATRLLAPLVTVVEPDIGVTVTGTNAIRAFLAMLVMALVGAVVPVARILRVDPLLVFRR